jgi:hypothetical protein
MNYSDLIAAVRSIIELNKRLIAVTEQRDEARQKIENQAERITYLEGATNHANGTPLTKAINQRDRLAMALQELCKALLTDEPRDITELLNKAGDALQSLTTPTQTETE